MSASIPAHPLSTAFREITKDWRVTSAIFCTFEFSPGFFEQEILPDLVETPVSHVGKIRLLQLEEGLRHVPGVSVLATPYPVWRRSAWGQVWGMRRSCGRAWGWVSGWWRGVPGPVPGLLSASWRAPRHQGGGCGAPRPGWWEGG